MMFLSEERRRVTVIPLVGLAGAAGFTALIGYFHRTTSDLVLFGAIAVIFWAMVLDRLRSVRREDDVIVVWKVYGSQSLGAKSRHVAVTQAGRGPMRVELIEGRTIEPTTTGTLVVHQTQFGEGRTAAALDTAHRIGGTLGLGEPLLAPWLVNERGLHVLGSSQPRPRWRWQWPRPSPYTLLVVALVVVSLVVTFVNQVGGAHLTLRMTQPHDVKGPVGSYMINQTTSQPYEPGPTFIEVWSPGRGCWAHRDLILKKKVNSILDLDRLADNGPCATDSYAHTPPEPPRPRNR